MHALALALVSGIPALVYQVVWTREVVLLAGSQLDAIATVVAAFFGGLALGSRFLGPLSDRSAAPLRLYGWLEIAAALLAAASFAGLRALDLFGPAHSGALLGLSALAIAPVTFLLGGTQPALLRSVAGRAAGASRPAGGIVGANTLGSLLGVALAIAAIPQLGLILTFHSAAVGGLALGGVALALSRIVPVADRVLADDDEEPSEAVLADGGGGSTLLILALAAAAGVATLGFEVLSARMAGMRLGSSLYAWGTVLGLFLLGLGAGNLAFARYSVTAKRPAATLAWLEVGAAVWLASGLGVIHPPLGEPATGLALRGLWAVTLGVLPAAFLMGGAFPFFARLAIDANVGRSFGTVSAWNTAGGIAGALLVPAVLLPGLGLIGAVHACAGLNLVVAGVLFARAEREQLPGRIATLLALFAVAAAVGGWGVRQGQRPDVISVEHGRNASVVVLATRGRRDLVVDGDPEASTDGQARTTEELLAALPLALHPAPLRFLEIGLGSGITLGTAARFPLERLDCVEISDAVIESVRFFEPDNRGVVRDPRVRLLRRDARVFLRGTTERYDVVAANTLHPWSLGATGLYSREYFARLAAVLAPGGVAAQWLPVRRIGLEGFGAIVRSFYEAFEHGTVFWGADNVILIGAHAAIAWPGADGLHARLEAAGLPPALAAVSGRRIAGAADVRAVLGVERVLWDDRPRLEALAATRAALREEPEVLDLLASLASAATKRGEGEAAMQFWLEAQAARARGAEGSVEFADRRDQLAEGLGLELPRQARAARLAAEGRRQLLAGKVTEAEARYERALRADPNSREATLGRAVVALRQGRDRRVVDQLETWLVQNPNDPFAWDLLAGIQHRLGDAEAALHAVERALTANPFFPEALSTFGLIAVQSGDRAAVDEILGRLELLGAGTRGAALRELADAHLEARTR